MRPFPDETRSLESEIITVDGRYFSIVGIGTQIKGQTIEERFALFLIAPIEVLENKGTGKK